MNSLLSLCNSCFELLKDFSLLFSVVCILEVFSQSIWTVQLIYAPFINSIKGNTCMHNALHSYTLIVYKIETI